MADSRKPVTPSKIRRPPATTLEGRENQLISLATSLAEKQMADGTASAQVITHYLKLATTRERLEQEKLTKQNELLRVQAEAHQVGQRLETLYDEAISAMRKYQGEEVDEEYDE